MNPLDHQLAQLIMPRLEGNRLGDPGYRDEILRLVRGGVGGFIIFGGDVEETPHRLAELQASAPEPLLFSADVERGLGQQLRGATLFPCQMAVAAALRPNVSKDRVLLEKMLAAVRRECRVAGLHWVFTPLLDVNTNPGNPIIGPRAFGEDPQRVATLGEAYTVGLQAPRPDGSLHLAACGKHFPGHGDTTVDSHTGLPRIALDRERLERVELRPFRRAVAAGLATVMVGHLQVPALEPEPIPATLSARVVTGMLRETLGFRGLVVSDAMDMAGVTGQGPAGEVASRCLAAGVDVLLHPADPWATLEGLQHALAQGRLAVRRVESAHSRLVQLKHRLGLFASAGIATRRSTEPAPKFGPHEHVALAEQIAGRAVTCVAGDSDILPLRQDSPVALVILDDDGQGGGTTLARALTTRLPATRVVRPGSGKPLKDQYDLLILAVFSRVISGKGRWGLRSETARVSRQVTEQARRVVVVSLGNPYILKQFPQASVLMAAYDSSDMAQKAVARALVGEIPCSGKPMFSLP